MTEATEYDFDRAVKAVVEKYNLTERQGQYIHMYCAENGGDCGARCWTVAIATLDMIIDQDQLIAVGNNEI